MEIDITELDLSPIDMPACPVCDEPIEAADDIMIANALQTLALIHADCADEET